jgi:hypothetical protein
MVSAAVLAVFCLTSPQEPLKWNDILSNMHRDIRTMKGVYEEWTLSGTSKDGTTSEGKMRRWMDGKRFRHDIEADGKVQMASSSDGSRMWTSIRPAGYYLWNDELQNPIADKWEVPKEEKTEEPTFYVGFSNAYDIVIRISPSPEVTKFEEVDGERRVTAITKTEDRTFTFTLHFEKEKWLLKEISGKSSTGPSQLSFKREKGLRDQTFESDVFGLDAKAVEGLEEATGETKEALLKALKGEG